MTMVWIQKQRTIYSPVSPGRGYHSTSAMTFMADSERAADLARETQIPVGLHLNLDEKFTGPAIPSTLREHHQKIAAYLNARKWNQILYNPFLRNAFRLWFFRPSGMNLSGFITKNHSGWMGIVTCIYVWICCYQERFRTGLKIRRNFTFYRGEKNPIIAFIGAWLIGGCNQLFMHRFLFFSMKPIDLAKLQRLVILSKTSDVDQLWCIPDGENEYLFLLSTEWGNLINPEKLRDDSASNNRSKWPITIDFKQI